MKWHITDQQQQQIQLEDETQFKKFFSSRGFNAVKIAENPITRTPDYELSKSDIRVICEIKSRFGKDEYGRINTVFTEKLSVLKHGYQYDFAHFFEIMPSQNDIDIILNQVDQEITTLPKEVRLPYTLRLGNFAIQNEYEQLIRIQPENREFYEKEMESVYSGAGNGQVVITLTKKILKIN